MKNRFNIIILLMATAMLASACENGEETEANGNQDRVRQVAVETITVERDSFEDFIRVSGVIEALEDAVVSSEASGRILEIADLGSSFQRGQVVARLDDRAVRAGYQAAKTAYELADDTFNRLNALYADSIISTQDFNNARAQRDQAKAQLEQAEKQLEDTRIVAPFSGRVEERMVRTGELINPGMPVFRLVNTNRVRAAAGIPERFSNDIREGTPVRLVNRTNGTMERSSSITFSGNVVDPDTRTYKIEAEFSNPEGIIKPEMVVDMHVLRRTIEDALIIPRTAIVRDEEGASVFVVREEDGRKLARLVSIRTGDASGAFIEITEGLSDGDEVVVSGMNNLSAGDRVNVLRNRSSERFTTDVQETNANRITY